MNSNGEKSNGGNGSGFTQIPNIIMDAVCRCVQGGAEGQVMWAILRRLYGYHVSAAHISIGQLVAATGLSRRAVIYALKNLEVKNIITVRRQKTESYNAVNVIAILDTTLWRTNGKGKSYAATLRKQKAKSAQKKLRPSPNQATTSAPAPAEAPTAAEKLADKLCRAGKANRTDADTARIQKLLAGGHSSEEISAMIDWSQSNSFWCKIIKNTSTFEHNYEKMLDRAGWLAPEKEYQEEKTETDGTELIIGANRYTYIGGYVFDRTGHVIPSGLVSALIRQGKAQVQRAAEVVEYVN
jgi:phage replication O-like protein O